MNAAKSATFCPLMSKYSVTPGQSYTILHKMPKIIECIPNFSEGRNKSTIRAILDAISEEGVAILHHTSDVDHNRTVITFAGTPQAVQQAAFRGIQVAGELIDLRKHEGVHPRLGATDVVPFVPIEDMTLQECAALAHELGQRVASELSIPVFMYEAAATRSERQNLANVRRGGYEGLARRFQNPDWQPDYGEAQVGSAGATIIGARNPLIAFNVFLNTNDVKIAKRIARKIRASSGGLPAVKALGLLVKGRAQISMNLVDYRQTSLFEIIEAIQIEAKHHGVAIADSELIGLIPEQAIINTVAQFLRLNNFSSADILENQLRNTLNT